MLLRGNAAGDHTRADARSEQVRRSDGRYRSRVPTERILVEKHTWIGAGAGTEGGARGDFGPRRLHGEEPPARPCDQVVGGALRISEKPLLEDDAGVDA